MKINNNKLKKISYFLNIKERGLRSEVARKMAKITLRSIFNQTVPFCELIITVSSADIKQAVEFVNQIIHDYSAGGCVNFEQDKYLKKTKYYNSTSTSTSFDQLTNRVNGIRIFELKGDDVGLLIQKISNDNCSDWIVYLEPGVVVAPYATYEFLMADFLNPNASLIYADHDSINAKCERGRPIFKPRFSLDLFYSQNYIGMFFAIRNVLVTHEATKRFKTNLYEFIPALVFGLIEYVINDSKNLDGLRDIQELIVHIPKLLSSHRSYNSICKGECFFEYVARHTRNVYPNVVCNRGVNGIIKLEWPVPKNNPLVSLIIPTKDGFSILKKCIESILKKTTYSNYEILIVDNQSTDSGVLLYLNDLEVKYDYIKVLKYDKPFNYSDINNWASTRAAGSILGFVNNDIEVISPGWLTELVSHASRSDVGCVGALHYYPDSRVQHAGVVVGMHGVADHAFKGETRPSKRDPMNYLYSVRNPDAVTAATMLVKRKLFNLVGKFDSKHLKVAFNDVDLCLKVSSLGYRCVWTPYAELFHHESETRRLTPEDEKYTQEHYEQEVMKSRWSTDVIEKRELLKYS